jgi:hypothetical protein
MVDRYPFHLDVVEASIRLGAPVALEQTVLLLIVSASLDRFPSVVHFWSVVCFYTPHRNDGPQLTSRLLN